MLHYKLILIPIFTLCFAYSVSAQNAGWEAGMFVGFSVYQGDLSYQNFLKESNPAIGFSARYDYYYTLKFRANLLLGTIDGDDKNEPERASRGFSFKTNLIELSGMVEWEPFGRLRALRGGRSSLKFSPFLLGGMGFCFAKPQAMFPELGVPGSQNPIQQDLKYNKSNVHLIIPIGFGVRYDVNRQWTINAEGGPRFPFTDYLDGISKAANPDAGDWYWFYGLTAMYNFQ